MRLLSILFWVFIPFSIFSQIHVGTVVFERKTNIKKILGESLPDKWNDYVKEPKIDLFTLDFNDSSSLFKASITDQINVLDWAVNFNTIYSKPKSKLKTAEVNFLGESYLLNKLDSIKIEWKITESKRAIAGFTCIKAITKRADGSTLYAWFCPFINPSFGPEGFGGLPGMILGIALEDGSIVYFAKSVTTENPGIIEPITTEKSKNKSTLQEFKLRMSKPGSLSDLNKKLYLDLIKWL